VLYRKREQARRVHEHGVFARFRYKDLKEAGRGCDGRGPYANSMVGQSGVEVSGDCAAARHTICQIKWFWADSISTSNVSQADCLEARTPIVSFLPLAPSEGVTLSEEMKGKVVVITGATSGIGQVAAEILAGMGALIAQVARDRDRGEDALKRLNEVAPGLGHSIHYADLLLLPEMQRVTSEIAAAESRIDVLINNVFSSRHVTPDGLEYTFALNQLSYFVLTQGLRERLIASAPARVVNTVPDAHEAATLDLVVSRSEWPKRACAVFMDSPTSASSVACVYRNECHETRGVFIRSQA
jgi:short chain dehydrogenase